MNLLPSAVRCGPFMLCIHVQSTERNHLKFSVNLWTVCIGMADACECWKMEDTNAIPKDFNIRVYQTPPESWSEPEDHNLWYSPTSTVNLLKPQQDQASSPEALSQEGDVQRTLIQVDFGDGIAVSYVNLSSMEDGIKHVYHNVGIFRVTVQVDNSLGSDSAVLYLHVTCPLEHVHLSLPFVTTKNKEVNATAVLWPSQVGTLTYVWWYGNNTEPLITLEGSISFRFTSEGMNTITVQVSAGNAILQDTKTIAVYEEFRSLRLSFSPNLDDYNPDIPEWRRDISRVIKKSLVEATGVPGQHILVAVLPGLPTAAELFVLPYQDPTGENKRSPEDLEQISELLIHKLNQNLVHFELKPGVQVLVHAAHLTAAPLVDLTPTHSGSAMLMLLSVVFVGLAVFVIYKFKRKIPGINVYAQMHNEKEREMVSRVSHPESRPHVPQTELRRPGQLVDEKVESQLIETLAKTLGFEIFMGKSRAFALTIAKKVGEE
ncbi:hypothetical protein CB1_001036001 [Camelus ferus]|nr:hypothetical protein CB1_001036001 [Camelus ferus]